MSDLPPDLDRLRVLQIYLRMQLAEVDARIKAAEQTEQRHAGQRPGEATPTSQPAAAPEGGRAQPDPGAELKWWRFIPGRSGAGGGVLHRGDCRTSSGGALLSTTEASLMLDEPHVKPCPSCQPQTRLRS